jgi:chemotaxis protein CheD
MRETETPLPQVYLQPGEMFFASNPTIIETILGSCVGVTFWNRRLGVGALCHAMLPQCPAGMAESISVEDGRRYVDFCIRDLAKQFEQHGIAHAEIQVKVFGGADMLQVGDGCSRPSIGRLNRETALDILEAEGYSVIASSLGDAFGRKIKFNTESGDVMVRRLV